MKIVIGEGSCGLAAGAGKVHAKLDELFAASNPTNAVVTITSCIGMCFVEPIVDVYEDNGTLHRLVRVKEEDAATIHDAVTSGDLSKLEPLTISAEDASFLEKQTRIALRNCGIINPMSIDEYIKKGGYEALKKILGGMTQDDVIEEIDKSGLKGRGGAGFSTAFKWRAAKASQGTEKYLICNADEGDPGAFMDRSVLEGDPHRVLEGMAICGYAMGADEGYIYVRAEYPLAIKRLRTAIAQAEEMGLLGEHIFESDFSFTIHIKEGAGAFVCGEETALMASIEGKRGMPRPRPPFPAVSGLWGKPTNINNVETFANVAQIIVNGADWYCQLGTEKSKGTKVFALTGKINNTGLAEVPMGITMREIIYDIGGGVRISSIRFVPSRQGVHLPQDSDCVKFRKNLATSTMQVSSSITISPPEPIIEPIEIRLS